MQFFTSIVEFGTPAYEETVELRKRLLKTPLGIDFDLAELQSEYKDFHLACYNEQLHLLGCLILTRIDDEQVKMRQVAVDTPFQRKGIGERMVKMSEVLALKEGFTKMVLNARDTAIPFYQKLNYQVIGEPFTEVGIKHFKMDKNLV